MHRILSKHRSKRAWARVVLAWVTCWEISTNAEDGIHALANVDQVSTQGTKLEGSMWWKETGTVAKECIDKDYYGVNNLTQALLPLLQRSTSIAKIINVSSIRGAPNTEFIQATRNRHPKYFSLCSLSTELELSKNRFFIGQVKQRVMSWVELALPLKVIDDQLGKLDTRDHNKSSFLFPSRWARLTTPQRICSTGALGLSNPDVFPVRHRLMIVVSALHGWNMSLVTTLDKFLISFGYPNSLTKLISASEGGGEGIVELFFVGTEYQLAELFTKSLPVERFQYLVRRLGYLDETGFKTGGLGSALGAIGLDFLTALVGFGAGDDKATGNRHPKDFSLCSLSTKLKISKNRFFIGQVKQRVRSWVELVLPLKVIDDQLGKPDTQDHNKSSLLFPSAISISCNPVQHSRTKHIHTRYQFIKEHVENGIIELYFVRTEYQLADMFTKSLPEDRFTYLVRRIGMRCLTPAELEVLAKESA
nr:retrovirus-related Pol polyprotein from transposon TNT 1-94 [Tanacetum cinerariifolium]